MRRAALQAKTDQQNAQQAMHEAQRRAADAMIRAAGVQVGLLQGSQEKPLVNA